MSDPGFRQVARTGLAPLVEQAPEGPTWAEVTSIAVSGDIDQRFRFSPWLAALGSAIVVLTLVGIGAFLGGNKTLVPTTSTNSTNPVVGFQPPTRTVDGETYLDLTLLDGTQLTLSYPADLDLTSRGAQADVVGGVGAPNRQVEVRYETPADFVAKIEEYSGPGELTDTLTGPDGGTVERWEFSDISYLVFDFEPWTATVWDTRFKVSSNIEGWAENLHGTIDANGYLVLSADPPLSLVPAGDDPPVDGPDIRVEGDSGSLLVFIDDCARMSYLGEQTYGETLFAFCDEPTNTLFYVSGSSEVQQRVHETLRVNPEEPSTTTTTTAVASAPPPGFDRVWGLAYPPEWYRADSDLMPNLGFRSVTVATMPLRPGGDNCAQVPENAIRDMTPQDVLVTVFFRGVLDPQSPPLPTALDERTFPVSGTDAEECSERPDLQFHWDDFTVGNESVYILVVFGSQAGQESRSTVWEILSSLQPIGAVTGGNSGVCVVTRPGVPGLTPPQHYNSDPFDPESAWYGTDELFTPLNVNGQYRPRKSVWWSAGFLGGGEEQNPNITVTWQRLDAESPPILGERSTNAYTPEDGSFMIVGFDPNTPGCWEVTAKYRGASLTYVYAKTEE